MPARFIRALVWMLAAIRFSSTDSRQSSLLFTEAFNLFSSVDTVDNATSTV